MLYPVGIPEFLAALLFMNRDVLSNKSSREYVLMSKSSSERYINTHTNDALSVRRSNSDLRNLYMPPRFYNGMVDCGKRVVLPGVTLVLISLCFHPICSVAIGAGTVRILAGCVG